MPGGLWYQIPMRYLVASAGLLVFTQACAEDRPSFDITERFEHPQQGETDMRDAEAADVEVTTSDNTDGSSECDRSSDCTAATQCLQAECAHGVCEESEVKAGKPCDLGVCDGHGECVECVRDDDCGVTDCVDWRCEDNACLAETVEDGSSCGKDDELVCDKRGTCVGCISPEDCGDSPGCSAYFCNADGECVLEPLEAGFVVEEASSQDCRARQCDGKGAVALLPDDNRCDDGIFCNGLERCDSDGSCSHADRKPCEGHDEGPICDDSCDEEAQECTAADAVGTACSDGRCDGSGACRKCLENDDCPDDTPFCSAGECVECVDESVCEASDCWVATCVESICDSTPAEINSVCGRAGDLLCDGAGTCAGCVIAEDCGEPTVCNSYSCSEDGECVLQAVAAGRLDDASSPDDCRVRQCDGEGNALLAPDDARCDDGLFCNGQELCQSDGTCAPAGAVPCTDDSAESCADGCDEEANACTAPDERGTTCTGGWCDGSGSCVACLSDDDCSAGAPFCSSAGTCVECLSANQCSAADGECTLAQTCGEDGRCRDRFEPSGTPCTEALATECSVPECDGSGSCIATNLPDLTPCDDDDPCTQASACDGSGECVGTVPTCSAEGEVCDNGTCSCGEGFRSCAEGCRIFCSDPQFDEENTTSIAIPDGSPSDDYGSAYSSIQVADAPYPVGKIVVEVNISHSYIGDVIVVLEAPDDTFILLFDPNDLSTDQQDESHMSGTVFDNDAPTLVTDGTAPYTGTFRPSGDLETFNSFEPNGSWDLWVFDDEAVDTGTLNSWRLTIY